MNSDLGSRCENYEDYVAKVRRLINTAEAAVGEAEEQSLLIQAESAAKAGIQRFPQSSDLNYALGLIYYYLGAYEAKYQEEALAYLRIGAEGEEHRDFARLYMGHVYFDRGDYEAALQMLNTVQLEVFASLEQYWRILKIEELQVCCQIYLDSAGACENFINHIEHARDVDPVQVPAPLELVRALIDKPSFRHDCAARGGLTLLERHLETQGFTKLLAEIQALI